MNRINWSRIDLKSPVVKAGQMMKTAAKIVFLLNDQFGAAIAGSLTPHPNSPLRTTQQTFTLNLDNYQIEGGNSSGKLLNFVDQLGSPQISIILLELYESPIVVCAINELLASITAQDLPTKPTFIVPLAITEPGFDGGVREFTYVDNNFSVYGAHLGPTTEIAQQMISRLHKLPTAFQISSEPLACLLELVKILNLPIVFVVGSGGQKKSETNFPKELVALANVGEFLATSFGLFFSKDPTQLIPMRKAKSTRQPWQDLYG